jgi:hypothetical protein
MTAAGEGESKEVRQSQGFESDAGTQGECRIMRQMQGSKGR